MANKERILQLADILEKGMHKFNGITAAYMQGEWLMEIDSRWIRKEGIDEFRKDIKDPFACNTAACMAGFACLLFDYENASKDLYVGTPGYSIPAKAIELLDITDREAELLFYGAGNGVTGPEAAKVLRHFAETGKIDWSI